MRLLVTALASGSGKTTVSLALALAFRAKGLRVQAFKVGPDYIDPTHLARATGRPVRNLDGFFLKPAGLLEVFQRGIRGSDLALIEGVMGFFDGKDPLGRVGSTLQVARLLKAPVVLVVDASGMAGSIAALALGFRRLARGVRLAGVVANRVGSHRHAEILKEALTARGIPFLGYLPKDPALALPERHLGLVLAQEVALPEEALLKAAQGLDLEAILKVAASAPPLVAPTGLFPEKRPKVAALALAQDEAFNFYYPEALELLEALGLDLIPFSPLSDPKLPPGVGGVYLGGGYPELYAQALSENRALREELRRFKGVIYGECGGYMYLAQALRTEKGRFSMLGLVPGEAVMAQRPILGYREVVALRASPVARKGMVAKGHEFHYSRLDLPGNAWRQKGGHQTEGYTDGRILGSYIHLYFPAKLALAERFVAKVEAWSSGSKGRPRP